MSTHADSIKTIPRPQAPARPGDLLRLCMERSDLRFQLLPLGSGDTSDHGYILLGLAVDPWVRSAAESPDLHPQIPHAP